MPRQRRRRRRGPASRAPVLESRDHLADRDARVAPQRRIPVPSAAVIFALCFGIWLGLALASTPGTVPTLILWISVVGAGLAAGRLLRNWMLRRRREAERR